MEEIEKNSSLSKWIEQEILSEKMLALIGQLYRNNNVVTTIFKKGLINKSVIDIINEHKYTEIYFKDKTAILIQETFPIIQIMQNLNLARSQVDIGILALKYRQVKNQLSLESFIQQELNSVINKPSIDLQGKDVVLYGFGRIGRLLTRIIIQQTGSGNGLRIKAIVVRNSSVVNDLEKRVNLLAKNSVHGNFKGNIKFNLAKQQILVNGNLIQIIYANNPTEIDYTKYGINNAILIDNTGKWRDQEGLSQHLQCHGIEKVFLTAPGKGDIKNIVYGINHQLISQEDKIISAASCTTNAIVPVLKVINDEFEIKSGHIETVHSYTNDQNLIDNFHKGNRRGRSAALNMVITETGAAIAAAKALPALAGKTTVEDINKFLFNISLFSEYNKQIGYSDSSEAVSTDFIGMEFAGVVDACATKCTDNNIVLYIWYDNEYSYSSQVVRLVKEISNVYPPSLPKICYKN